MMLRRKKPADKEAAQGADESFFRQLQVEFLIHEMKDPVSVIETGLRTLLERRDRFGDLSPRQEKTLKRSLRSAGKLRDMLLGMLEVGRSEAGCFVCAGFNPFDALVETVIEAMQATADGERAADLLNDCADPAAAAAALAGCGVMIRCDGAEARADIFQDETKFRFIIGNLVKNALHFHGDRVEITMRADAERLYVDVADDGPGIDPKHHALVFQRYARIRDQAADKAADGLQRKGHGLGLAGAMCLARRLGGTIELRSKKGNGATFRLALPRKWKGGDD